MRRITEIEQKKIVGGFNSESSSLLNDKDQFICDLPLPVGSKGKGGIICIYPTLKDPEVAGGAYI